MHIFINKYALYIIVLYPFTIYFYGGGINIMVDIKIRIGQRIQELRIKQGLSQEALALKADVSTSHIGKLERGERNATIESLEKVVNALNVSFLDIFRFSDNDRDVINDIVNKLSHRSIKDQEIILNLLDALPPWENDNDTEL